MPPPHSPSSLRAWLAAIGPAAANSLHGLRSDVALAELARGSRLSIAPDRLSGRSLLLAAKDPLAAALALIELDGIARRLVLCPPDLPRRHIPQVIETAAVDAAVVDRAAGDWRPPAGMETVVVGADSAPAAPGRPEYRETQWVLLTSGTTGVPKLVVHTLATLAGAFAAAGTSASRTVWSTFYDIRRYGGLQIFLRAVCGGGSLVLPDPEETTADFLARAGRCGVTHISGTPSHWRGALMNRTAGRIAPHYVRLSGEIADQTILDRLHAAYPAAGIGHAFASTEAGVGFEVNDGLAGFPASLVGGNAANGVEIRIEDGSLRLRSGRTALGYLGIDNGRIAGADGFVDTGDMVERRGDRYHFVGRKGGIVNVGGCKVYPEEVEAVINRHPRVAMSRVRARGSPITGAVVVADVVAVAGDREGAAAPAEIETLTAEIRGLCRDALVRHKVPAVIRVVSSLDLGASGKLARRDA